MKTRYVIAPIIMLAVLIALSTPASAVDGPEPIDSYNQIVDSVAHGTFTIQWTKNPSPFTFYAPNNLDWVGIYDSVWMPNDPVYATYNGHTLPDSYAHSSSNTLYTGLGTCGVWFDDETGNTTPNAYNTYQSSNWDNAHGVGVPIVHLDYDNPNTLYYWFYQGYDDVGGSSWVYYTFTGIDPTVATEWTLMLAVTCADSGKMRFNGADLTGSGFSGSTKFYHVAIHDVTGMVNNGINVVGFNPDGDDYTHPYWMALIGYTPQPKPDLIVTDIDAGTPRPSYPFAVSTTIKNQGTVAAGASTANLYANGVLKSTTAVPGLAADTDTTVSFTGVTLSEGCYEFKVVADALGVVDESNEYNNASSEDVQVGYVIDVRSDSDFVALEADLGMPSGSVTYDSGSDTYHIQDLVITNCAGEGIYIEGVTKNFVVNNCTIENCKPMASGMFLNDVTKGTINGSTFQNNEAYGIELGLVPLSAEDPKNINITRNTFYNNSYGVELIGSNCTVKNNTIHDNTIYGLYLYGNYNSLYINNISNSGSYGMKVYNSTGNNICGNAFIDNNGVGVQAWDNSVGSNCWNTTNPIGYCTHPGTCYTNRTGNYWSDYPSGNDPDGDGIGNTPYSIYGGAMVDYYPMVVSARQPPPVPAMCGDVMCDSVGGHYDVDGGDVIRLSNYLNGHPVPINYWTSNVRCDGEISGGDRIRLSNHVDGHAVPCSCCPPWEEGFPGCACSGGTGYWPGCSCPGFEALLAIAAIALIVVPCLVRKRKD